METTNAETTNAETTNAETTNGRAKGAQAVKNREVASIAGKHLGSCHCGAVRFEVELEAGTGGSRCNCTICTKVAQTGAIAKPHALRLLDGADSLSTYEWGGKTARRYFCKHCGVHTFARGYLKELGGDYVSINLNALDDVDVSRLPLVHWDGRHNNWYAGPRPTPWPIADGPA